ncbi:MAG: hypothetical protein LBT79_03845 [Elusimicrobiota bacterium]|jgi:hypothetical protein|nr:hypothetical protein [Elusimicrobiota bacterium]
MRKFLLLFSLLCISILCFAQDNDSEEFESILGEMKNKGIDIYSMSSDELKLSLYNFLKQGLEEAKKEKKDTNGIIDIVKPTKTNMAWNYMLYDELSAIDNNERLLKIKEDIYNFSYNYEKNEFIKVIGLDFDDKFVLIDGVLIGYNPDNKLVYEISFMRVLQSAKDGILINYESGWQDPTILAFIYTTEKFVDNQPLKGRYVRYAGTYSYITVLGAKKNIYAFRFIDLNRCRKEMLKFYFYPKNYDYSNEKYNLSTEAKGERALEAITIKSKK